MLGVIKQREEEMKEIIRKYFDYIGVENEGYRRVLSILLPIPIILFFLFSIPEVGEERFFNLLFFQESDWFDLYFYLLFFLLSPLIIVGVITKIINWVKEGFKK